MIGDAGKHVREPRLGIGARELRRLDEREHDGRAVAAFVRAAEGPVAPAYGDAPDRALGGIVRQADAAVFEEARKHLPTIEGVVDGLGKWPLGEKSFRRSARSQVSKLSDERF